MQKKKILILSASTGAGHVQAGKSIEAHAAKHEPNLEVIHQDIADFLSFPMRKALVDSYNLLIKASPELWSLLYKQTDRPVMGKYLKKIMKLGKKFNFDDLYEYISEFKPDYILSTQFTAPYILSAAPKKYKVDCPTGLLVTDYALHTLLAFPELSHFFVPSQKMKWILAQHGFDATEITASGIPVRPEFFETKKNAGLKKKLSVPSKKPVILVLAGGYGLSKSDAIIQTLFKLEKPHHLIAIAGKNKRLHNKIAKLKPPNHISLDIVGWTDAMADYMRVSDAIVSKPGGITVTECMTLNKPLIAINPIPGQEDRNAHHLLETQKGFLAHDPYDLLYYIANLGTITKTYKRTQPQNAAQTILKTIQESL